MLLSLNDNTIFKFFLIRKNASTFISPCFARTAGACQHTLALLYVFKLVCLPLILNTCWFGETGQVILRHFKNVTCHHRANKASWWVWKSGDVYRWVHCPDVKGKTGWGWLEVRGKVLGEAIQLLQENHLLNFVFLATPRGMCDLSSPTRDRTHISCSRWVLTTEPRQKSHILAFFAFNCNGTANYWHACFYIWPESACGTGTDFRNNLKRVLICRGIWYVMIVLKPALLTFTRNS